MTNKPLSKRQEALSTGKTTYESNPCKKCSSVRRYTSCGNCIQCLLNRRAEERDRYLAAKEKLSQGVG